MGKERNVPLTERSNKQLHYYDDEICKFTLCGLCPYTLFSNTKSFLGESVKHAVPLSIPDWCCLYINLPRKGIVTCGAQVGPTWLWCGEDWEPRLYEEVAQLLLRGRTKPYCCLTQASASTRCTTS